MSTPQWQGQRGPIACVHLPHFPWQAESKRRPSLRKGPVVIVEGGAEASKSSAVRVVFDCSPDMKGVLPGMPLSEAMARHKDAVILASDHGYYQELFEEILAALENRCPDVEDAGLGLAYVGIWGLEGLYGGDAQVVRVLASAVPRFDLRIGVGENKWVSYVAACGSRSGSARKVTGEPGRFMSRFPVDILPIRFRTMQRLHAFGLHRMEDIAALQRGAMQAQFGVEGAWAWELANGLDDRPLLARRVQEALSEYLAFPDPTVSMTTILPGIESLLARAFIRPQLRQRYAREAVVESRILRRAPWLLRVPFKDPAGSTQKAFFSIKSKLDTVSFPGPLEDLRLTLSGITAEVGRQESMWAEVRKEQQLHDAISQLQARLGATPPIYQVRELEPWSRIPERRHALVQLSP